MTPNCGFKIHTKTSTVGTSGKDQGRVNKPRANARPTKGRLNNSAAASPAPIDTPMTPAMYTSVCSTTTQKLRSANIRW